MNEVSKKRSIAPGLRAHSQRLSQANRQLCKALFSGRLGFAPCELELTCKSKATFCSSFLEETCPARLGQIQEGVRLLCSAHHRKLERAATIS